MESVVRRLIALLSEGPSRSAPNQLVGISMDDAPSAIAELLAALTTRGLPAFDVGNYRVDCGSRGGRVTSAADSIASVNECLEENDDTSTQELFPELDPNKTLLLGIHAGLSDMALSWGRGKIEIILIEIDEPMPEECIEFFESPGELSRFLTENFVEDSRGWAGVDRLFGSL